jgi:hypothetical protein
MMTPMIVASVVFSFLNLNIQKPMNTAIGIVIAMVNVPHELSAKAFTTTSPIPARATIRMIRIAMEAMVPLVLLTSARAISASDLPS